MEVRKANFKDLDALAELFNAYRVFYGQLSDINNSRSFLNDRMTADESIIFVADVEGALVGFTQLYPTFSSVSLERFYVLNDLFVNPEYRKRHIGKALLNAAQELVRKKGYKGLSLETGKENPARYLYEREGWKVDEDYYHMFWKRT